MENWPQRQEIAQGTKQGQSQGLWCFSQGKGGLKRDVQVPRSVPSPAPWAVSGQVLRGSVWEEGTCMFPCPGDRRRDQPELGHTGRVLAILQTRSPCPSGWRHRGLTPRIAVNAQGELQRDPGSCKARAGPCKQGLPRAGLGSRREKPTEGRSGWPFPRKWATGGREDVARRKIQQQLISSYCPSVPAEQRQVQRKGQVRIQHSHCTVFLAQQSYKLKCKCGKNVRLSLQVYERVGFELLSKVHHCGVSKREAPLEKLSISTCFAVQHCCNPQRCSCDAIFK